MKIREHATKAAEDIATLLDNQPTSAQITEIANLIEKEIVTHVMEARNRSAQAAMDHSEHDSDIAHQISKAIHRENELLMSNLSSLR
ncbi:MAG: hypothetical protein ACPGOV_16655 [Magnetovibrionaceae bacterium]